MKNKVNRELPDEILKTTGYKPFESVEVKDLVIERVSAKVRQSVKPNKLVDSLEEVVLKTVKDGMTISFHHHFREGDYVFNKVMRIIIDHGFKDLRIAPSSLTNVMNDILVEAIEKGVVTNITSSGMRGTLGDVVSHGALKNPVIFRSHGGRARAIETGEIHIDVAFLGTPNADEMGNANGMDGKAPFGLSLIHI